MGGTGYILDGACYRQVHANGAVEPGDDVAAADALGGTQPLAAAALRRAPRV